MKQDRSGLVHQSDTLYAILLRGGVVWSGKARMNTGDYRTERLRI